MSDISFADRIGWRCRWMRVHEPLISIWGYPFVIVDGKPFNPDEIEMDAVSQGLARRREIFALRESRMRDRTVKKKGQGVGIVSVAAPQLAASRKTRN
jgi:hypothetical protein